MQYDVLEVDIDILEERGTDRVIARAIIPEELHKSLSRLVLDKAVPRDTIVSESDKGLVISTPTSEGGVISWGLKYSERSVVIAMPPKSDEELLNIAIENVQTMMGILIHPYMELHNERGSLH
jgi:hypothetical protein